MLKNCTKLLKAKFNKNFNKNFNKKFNKNKKLLACQLQLLVAFLLVPLPQNVHANNTLNISSWAIPTLNEGEKYGLFPMTWYLGDFMGNITADKLDYLLNNLENKLELLDLPTKDNFISHEVDYNNRLTRGNIIIEFYNILDKYDFGQYFEKPIDYFTEKLIVIGDGANLNLDSIASTEQAVIIATRFIETIYNDLDAGSKGFVWEVSNINNINNISDTNTKNNKVYLLGSIHMATSDIYPLNQKLKDAFDTSDDLYVEVNLLEQNPDIDGFLELAKYDEGSSIKEQISQETYEKLALVCEVLDISLDHMENFKPWSITNDLTTFVSTENQTLEEVEELSQLGVDMYFLTRSLVENKTINELESYEIQGMLFNDMSIEIQEANLNEILNNIILDNKNKEENNINNNIDAILNQEVSFEDIAELDNFEYSDNNTTTTNTNNNNATNKLIETWLNYFKNGDIEGMTQNFNDLYADNEYSNALLTDERDENMARQIMELLEADGENTHFVVVGAAHFLLEGAIVDILRDNGYNVEFFY